MRKTELQNLKAEQKTKEEVTKKQIEELTAQVNIRRRSIGGETGGERNDTENLTYTEILRRFQDLRMIKDGTTDDYLKVATLENLKLRLEEVKADIAYIVENWKNVPLNAVRPEEKTKWTDKIADARKLQDELDKLICGRIKQLEQSAESSSGVEIKGTVQTNSRNKTVINNKKRRKINKCKTKN